MLVVLAFVEHDVIIVTVLKHKRSIVWQRSMVVALKTILDYDEAGVCFV